MPVPIHLPARNNRCSTICSYVQSTKFVKLDDHNTEMGNKMRPDIIWWTLGPPWINSRIGSGTETLRAATILLEQSLGRLPCSLSEHLQRRYVRSTHRDVLGRE